MVVGSFPPAFGAELVASGRLRPLPFPYCHSAPGGYSLAAGGGISAAATSEIWETVRAPSW
jgi:hypothetical protein